MSKEEVQRFVDTTKFDGYQGFVLPYGIKIPGKDKSRTVSTIFPKSLNGKSVLDVGCSYGYYAHEAKKRGATRVVGVEMNEETARIAREITLIMDDDVEILSGDIMKTKISGKFDVVLLLNVLHHVADPIGLMKGVAHLCCGKIIVEFCLPTDDVYRRRHIRTNSWIGKLWVPVRDIIRIFLVKALGSLCPIIVVGGIEYHRMFYFSTKAFWTTFVVHNKIFTDIEFKPSPYKRHRILAFCKVAT